MLRARLFVDLPAEPLPRTGKITRLLLSLVTDPGPDEARDRLLGNALEILRTALGALAEVGFEDVVVIRAGTHVIYADAEQRLDDLEEALDEVVASGRLVPGFGLLTVVLSYRADGLHTVAEVVLDEEVARGEAPLSIELVSRIDEARVRPDETPPRYRERVRAWLADGGLDRQHGNARRLADALSTALSRGFGSASVRTQPPRLRVVAPGSLQVARFRHLGFGKRLRAPVYRPAPRGSKRAPAYDHPHVHYFFDPYHDLLSFIVVEAVLDGRAPAEQLTVVDPDERVLLEPSATAEQRDAIELPVARGLVTLEDDEVAVDESIAAAGLDAAEAGSPHAPGYGGEGYG